MRNYASSTSAFSAGRGAAAVGNVVTFNGFSDSRIADPPQGWWSDILRRLDELCSLPQGWDGYRAPPVSFSNAHFAMSLLNSACPDRSPAPQMIPGPNGDLQIEWHNGSLDIEVHIQGPYNVDAWRASPDLPEEGEEVHLKADFTIVAQWLTRLSESAVATRPAAA